MNLPRNLLSRIPMVITAIFLISCLVVTPQAAYADLSVFTPSTADTYIISGNPDYNIGSEEVFGIRSGTPPSDIIHALVKFDLSSIPSGATINSAYLLLYYIGHDIRFGDPSGRTLTVYRVTKSWIEGDGPDTPFGGSTGATWIDADKSVPTPWNTQGGDYVTDGSASATVPASVGQWMTWTVTDIVKSWIQGGQPNYRFLIRDPNEDQTSTTANVLFISREYSTDPELRPVLKVDWSPLPVGGLVMPTNKLEILAPYIALGGLIAAVSTVYVFKKRKD